MSNVVDYGTAEFRVRRGVVAQLAAQAAVAVPTRESLAVHGCYRVTVKPGWLELAGTDSMQTVLAGTQAVETASDVVLFLPAQRFKQILDAAPDGDIAVSVSGNMARVSAGGPHWDIKMPPPRSYPELIDPGSVTFSVARREPLLAGLKLVRRAVDRDVSRANYAQALIAKDAERMWITGYDGTQFCRGPVDGFPFETRVPAAMLADLIKLLERSQAEDVEVGEAGNALAVRTGLTVLACQGMAAEFPDVQRLVLDPTGGYTDELGVDRAELLRAIKRVAINAHPKTSALGLVADKGTVTVMTRDDADNTAEERVQAAWPHERRVIVVNHVFLAGLASAHSADKCVFRIGENRGRRLSMLRLEDPETGVISVIPQLPASQVGL